MVVIPGSISQNAISLLPRNVIISLTIGISPRSGVETTIRFFPHITVGIEAI